MSAPAIGRAGESFVLPGTDGLPYSLAQHSGGPLVVVFFKTTCPACRLAFPYLERLYQAHAAHGAMVWGISQDTLEDSLAFAVEHGVTFPILLDTTCAVSQTYDIEFVPTLFLLDERGIVLYSSTSFSKDDLNEIARLVADQTKTQPVVVAPANDGIPPFRPG